MREQSRPHEATRGPDQTPHRTAIPSVDDLRCEFTQCFPRGGMKVSHDETRRAGFHFHLYRCCCLGRRRQHPQLGDPQRDHRRAPFELASDPVARRAAHGYEATREAAMAGRHLAKYIKPLQPGFVAAVRAISTPMKITKRRARRCTAECHRWHKAGAQPRSP
jgi:hypothetical protein